MSSVGALLYAMIWKPLLTNAIALMVLSYVVLVVAFDATSSS